MPRNTGITASFTDGLTVYASTSLHVVTPDPTIDAIQYIQFGEGTSFSDPVPSGSNWGGWNLGGGSNTFFILTGTNLDKIFDARFIPRGSSSAEPSASWTGDPLQIGGAVFEPTYQLPGTYVLVPTQLQGYLYFDPDTWFEISVYSVDGGWLDTGIIFSQNGFGLNYYRGIYIYGVDQGTLYPGLPMDFYGFGLTNVTYVDITGTTGSARVAVTIVNDTGTIAALPDVGTGSLTISPVDLTSPTTPTGSWAGTMYYDYTSVKWYNVSVWQPGDLPASATYYNEVQGAYGVNYPGHNWINLGVPQDRDAYRNGVIHYTASFAASIDTGAAGPFPSWNMSNHASDLVIASGAAFPQNYAMSFDYTNPMYTISNLRLPKVTSVVRGTGSDLYGAYSLWIYGQNFDMFCTSTVPGNPLNFIWVALPDPGDIGFTWYTSIISVTPTLIKADWGLNGSWIVGTERDCWLQIWSYGYDCAGYDVAGNPVAGKEKVQFLTSYDDCTWNPTPPPYNNYGKPFASFIGIHLSQSYGNLTCFRSPL